ncbi:helix-turn-helix domain-containing protein [Novosphingobium sp. M1R2S20]|uniref:Helix-turn-helix domain-containing protein n=1 Tax=Novosphingobium rhizovicinum TaxID=3228928 RepID=A0ABV3R9P4_9SPHN
MSRTARFAVDIGPTKLRTTRTGQPLSYNRAPAADLSSWIARLAVTRIDQPADQTLDCGLFGETAAIRLQLSGELEVPANNHARYTAPSALFFGPQSKLQPLCLTGSLIGISVALRPGACRALMTMRGGDLVDKVIPLPDDWRDCAVPALASKGDPEDRLQALEQLFRAHITSLSKPEPDPIAADFEEIAFRDPTMSIAQAAREIGVDRRRLERVVHRDFGLPPKQVFRRARALDMAASLQGVADEEEAQAFALRYYDESHLIREFTELFGMSPRRFKALEQPLLTITLEARQARRLEILGRIEPGAQRPWQ